MSTSQHANGLRLSLPIEYAATLTTDGFLVEPADGNGQRRDPIQVSVRLLPDAPSGLENTRQWQGRQFRFTVTADSEGGSGGVDHNLVAAEQVGGQWIVYRQRRQSERGEPEFELWRIAEGVSLAEPP